MKSLKLTAVVQFESRAEAEATVLHMDDGLLDGLNIVVSLANVWKEQEESKRDRNFGSNKALGSKINEYTQKYQNSLSSNRRR